MSSTKTNKKRMAKVMKELTSYRKDWIKSTHRYGIQKIAHTANLKQWVFMKTTKNYHKRRGGMRVFVCDDVFIYFKGNTRSPKVYSKDNDYIICKTCNTLRYKDYDGFTKICGKCERKSRVNDSDSDSDSDY